MLDGYVRVQLEKMLAWHIGLRTGFSASAGKYGKYFQKYLEPHLWERLLQTYASGSYEETWDALFAMGDLFRAVAVPLAEHFGFQYPHADDRRVSAHLRHVRALPKDAKEMYP
jgi:aminoglycoside 6-adenylyltransferase